MGAVSAIQGDYVVGKGRIYVQIAGEDRMSETGDADAMSVSQDNQALERFSNQFATRTKTDSRTLQQNASISFTAVQMTARVLSLAMMSDKTFLTQGALSNQTKTVATILVGEVIDLGKLDVTIDSVTDGVGTVPVAYTLGTHYELDAASGLVKIIAIPGGAGPDLHIQYDVTAILASAKRIAAGVGGQPDLEAKIVFVALGDDGTPIEKYTFHRVKLTPDGDFGLISDEYRTVQIKGEIIADTTQPSGYELGTLHQLVASANTI